MMGGFSGMGIGIVMGGGQVCCLLLRFVLCFSQVCVFVCLCVSVCVCVFGAVLFSHCWRDCQCQLRFEGLERVQLLLEYFLVLL